MKEIIKIGVSGLGAMGTQHAMWLAGGSIPGLKLCSIADPNRGAALSADERLKSVPFFTNAEEMMRSGLIDAVILSTPPYLHASQAKCALNNGLHVLCEKPIGLHVEEAEHLAVRAKQNKLIYAMAMNQRHSPIHRRIHEALISHELGRIHRVIQIGTGCFRPLCYYQSAAWRATWKYEGGGMLMNQNAHALDLLLWWLGEPVQVSAQLGFGKFHANISVEDETNVCMLYPDGSTCNLITSTGDYPGLSLLEFHGDRGKLTVQNGRLYLEQLSATCSEFSRTAKSGFAHPEAKRIDLTPPDEDNSHIDLLKCFCQSIQTGDMFCADAADGLRALRLAHTIYCAAWNHTSITYPVDEQRFEANWLRQAQQEKTRQVKDAAMNLQQAWEKNH